jgi:hypothetical protein
MTLAKKIRSVIEAGLTTDYVMPMGAVKVHDTVNLMINYWSAFEAYGIDAATKLAREAA